MSSTVQKITPFLWFNDQAEQAAQFYTSIFPESQIVSVARYSEAAASASGKPADSVMTVDFQLSGQSFAAINGGPEFSFSEAVSFVVSCESQEEVDYYWERLSAGGPPEAQQCGWLKDQFGVPWQIVPAILPQLMADPDVQRVQRAMQALLSMKKIDIDALLQAADAHETAA